MRKKKQAGERIKIKWHFEDGAEQMTEAEYWQQKKQEAINMIQSGDRRYRLMGEQMLTELAGHFANASAEKQIRNKISQDKREAAAEAVATQIVAHHKELARAGKKQHEITTLIVERLAKGNNPRSADTVRRKPVSENKTEFAR